MGGARGHFRCTPGWPENVANYVAEYRTARVREVDVGIVQTLSNQNSHVMIGFKLVLLCPAENAIV